MGFVLEFPGIRGLGKAGFWIVRVEKAGCTRGYQVPCARKVRIIPATSSGYLDDDEGIQVLGGHADGKGVHRSPVRISVMAWNAKRPRPITPAMIMQ